MPKVMLDQPVADFKAPATSNKDVKLSQLKGYKAVFYFYPKDDTPGCIVEGQNFRDHYQAFKDAKTCVFGISRDSLESHERFKRQYKFPFELIADENEKLCSQFDIIKVKNMYGREILGVERSTFLLDENGILRKEWRGVRVDGHVQEVLQAAQEL